MLLNKMFISILTFTFLQFITIAQSAKTNQENNVCRTKADYLHRENNPNCYFNVDFKLNLPQLVKKYTGQSVQRYKITTDDGYILTMYRMHQKNPKGVVLLQHPILTGSLPYIHHGNSSLAMFFYNQGYEVWLNNQRGTESSQTHTKYNTRDYEYWNFSFHEVAVYDVPKEIELIRSKTDKKIIFFGHSMGTTVGLVYASLFPKESEEAIETYIFAGMTCYYKYNTEFVKKFAGLSPVFQALSTYFQIGYVVPMRDFVVSLALLLIRRFSVLSSISLDMAVIFNSKGNFTNPEKFSLDSSKMLENFSWKMVFHLFQLMKTETHFQQYDYGAEQNLIYYGTDTAPHYPIENITVPIYLMFSTDDILTSPNDTMLLFNRLPEKAKKYGYKQLSKLSHIDYIFGHYVESVFYDALQKFLDSLDF